jgi:hypothetical protein
VDYHHDILFQAIFLFLDMYPELFFYRNEQLFFIFTFARYQNSTLHSRRVKDNRSLWALLSLWVSHVLDGVKYCNNIYYSTLTILRTVVAMWPTSCNWPRNCAFFPGGGKRPFSQVSAFNCCSEQHQPWLIEPFFLLRGKICILRYYLNGFEANLSAKLIIYLTLSCSVGKNISISNVHCWVQDRRQLDCVVTQLHLPILNVFFYLY